MKQGVFSCEFFPPRTTEGNEKLRITRRQLEQLKPRFFSVTFGAGGTTRDLDPSRPSWRPRAACAPSPRMSAAHASICATSSSEQDHQQRDADRGARDRGCVLLRVERRPSTPPGRERSGRGRMADDVRS